MVNGTDANIDPKVCCGGSPTSKKKNKKKKHTSTEYRSPRPRGRQVAAAPEQQQSRGENPTFRSDIYNYW